MIPERITDGVKPVSAIKNTIMPETMVEEDLIPNPNFFNIQIKI